MITQNDKLQPAKEKHATRTQLKSRIISVVYIEIFEEMLTSAKTNRDLNIEFGYTLKSHAIVDHSRKVMYRLLALENLPKSKYQQKVIYPRHYKSWWLNLLNRHKPKLLELSFERARGTDKMSA